MPARRVPELMLVPPLYMLTPPSTRVPVSVSVRLPPPVITPLYVSVLELLPVIPSTSIVPPLGPRAMPRFALRANVEVAWRVPPLMVMFVVAADWDEAKLGGATGCAVGGNK